VVVESKTVLTVVWNTPIGGSEEKDIGVFDDHGIGHPAHQRRFALGQHALPAFVLRVGHASLLRLRILYLPRARPRLRSSAA
jgi:hypothetical protein